MRARLRPHAWLLAALASLPTISARSQDVGIDIAYLALSTKRVLPQSFLDQPPADEGLQGARLALADDQTTGRFIH